MEDCKELLYHDPLKLQDNIDCFLSEDHYYRGKLALSYYRDSQRVGDYVIFPMKFSRNFFVMGIDDTTGKIFVRLINGDPSIILEKGIREDKKIQRLKNFMGFTHHKWEITNLRKGQIVRIQGDFAMRVIKTFSSLDKLLNYLSFFPGIGANDIRSTLWEEFIRKYLQEDEELGKIERLLNVLDEIRRIRRISYMIGIKEREIAKVEEEVKQKLRDILGVKRIPERNRIYFMKISKMRDKFKEFIINKEEKLKIYYGHYTSPHLVQVIGILVGNQIIILREQEVVVTHKEHGISTFNISVPSIVEFGTLDNFSNITTPDFIDIIFI
ncbi:hypothetical protein EWF20_10830 [Sulfolobus sp. S-194]|uniref:hypothetical protein n=1 Tax=Sulfolobus sp. S-194 TaxID=2512240 RepID=UPI001436CDA7|nr:hypothetical protein [Sulfolobus sp. S-194]QIW24576.1 hypothetical protein EWF20_10830 [Sulfolobus sp. S-194]